MISDDKLMRFYLLFPLYVGLIENSQNPTLENLPEDSLTMWLQKKYLPWIRKMLGVLYSLLNVNKLTLFAQIE